MSLCCRPYVQLAQDREHASLLQIIQYYFSLDIWQRSRSLTFQRSDLVKKLIISRALVYLISYFPSFFFKKKLMPYTTLHSPYMMQYISYAQIIVITARSSRLLILVINKNCCSKERMCSSRLIFPSSLPILFFGKYQNILPYCSYVGDSILLSTPSVLEILQQYKDGLRNRLGHVWINLVLGLKLQLFREN